MNARLARTTLALAMLSPMTGWSAVMLVIDIVPPPLPMYAQPPVPGDGYLWTPGYWGWNERARDYNWVPGTWVRPPKVNFLWTPGYWAFQESSYRWHTGYWGPRVGYYGGLNYGYGYGGNGYEGGRWDHGYFRYNQAVNNVPAGGVYRVYNAPVIVRNQAVRESYVGGNSSAHAQPTADERRYQAEAHAGSTPEQVNHEKMAFTTPAQQMSANHGAPPVAATPRPSGFGEPGAEKGRHQPPEHARANADSDREPEGGANQDGAKHGEGGAKQEGGKHDAEGGAKHDADGGGKR